MLLVGNVVEIRPTWSRVRLVVAQDWIPVDLLVVPVLNTNKKWSKNVSEFTVFSHSFMTTTHLAHTFSCSSSRRSSWSSSARRIVSSCTRICSLCSAIAFCSSSSACCFVSRLVPFTSRRSMRSRIFSRSSDSRILASARSVSCCFSTVLARSTAAASSPCSFFFSCKRVPISVDDCCCCFSAAC